MASGKDIQVGPRGGAYVQQPGGGRRYLPELRRWQTERATDNRRVREAIAGVRAIGTVWRLHDDPGLGQIEGATDWPYYANSAESERNLEKAHAARERLQEALRLRKLHIENPTTQGALFDLNEKITPESVDAAMQGLQRVNYRNNRPPWAMWRDIAADPQSMRGWSPAMRAAVVARLDRILAVHDQLARDHLSAVPVLDLLSMQSENALPPHIPTHIFDPDDPTKKLPVDPDAVLRSASMRERIDETTRHWDDYGERHARAVWDERLHDHPSLAAMVKAVERASGEGEYNSWEAGEAAHSLSRDMWEKRFGRDEAPRVNKKWEAFLRETTHLTLPPNVRAALMDRMVRSVASRADRLRGERAARETREKMARANAEYRAQGFTPPAEFLTEERVRAWCEGPTYHAGDITISVEPGGNNITVYARLEDDEGRRVGYINRIFTRKRGVWSVYHSHFEVAEGYRGSGQGKEVFRRMINDYQKMGVKKVRVTAALDNGWYTWASFGFDWDPDTTCQEDAEEYATGHLRNKYGMAPERARRYARVITKHPWYLANFHMPRSWRPEREGEPERGVGEKFPTKKALDKARHDAGAGADEPDYWHAGKRILSRMGSWSGEVRLDKDDPSFRYMARKLKLTLQPAYQWRKP
jgi:ribosomal protein S18 acetylase RimI-like enzyme